MGNSHLSDRSCWARAMAVDSHEGRWARALPSQAQTEFTSHFLLCLGSTRGLGSLSIQSLRRSLPPQLLWTLPEVPPSGSELPGPTLLLTHFLSA